VYINTYMRTRNNTLTKSRSVELYNPSAYSGMFIRKFNVPTAYTRTTTYPTHTPLYVTKSYTVGEPHYEMMTKNSITPLWNVPDIFPLQNRRQILM
jgi:hypothetical protein